MKTLKVVWSKFAETELDKIFVYYAEKANLSIAKKLIVGLIQETDKIANHQKLGQIEDFIIGKNKEYRYLIFKNYKIIYYIDIEFNQVRVVDVFDVRQNPTKLSRKK